MRVIDHTQFNHKKKPRRSIKPLFIVICLVVIGAAVVLLRPKAKAPASEVVTQDSIQKPETNTATNATPAASAEFKQFTGQEFKDLYYSIAYPNTQQIVDPLPITGNKTADERIRKMAEERGYKQTVIPQDAIVKIDEPRLDGDDLLQPLAAHAWKLLKQSAQDDSIPLSIISAYRSPEWQRNLFLSRLYASGISANQVADGTADAAVNQALSTAAVPGYSRHHTGYTMDLWCEDGSAAFVNSSCYQWISKDNYMHAKEVGWIPSYPSGTDEQGPEPEPWEFVWVGTDALKK